MSLKSFHVFFIMVASLFALGMSLWAYLGASTEVMGNAARPFGVAAATLSAVLFGYGLWFAFKKSKTIII
jgi:hypothetical protein